MTLTTWFGELAAQFDNREKSYMTIHHARLQVQIKDAETGLIELHDLRYSAKGAPEFRMQQEGTR